MGDFASNPSWWSTSALILFFVIFNISSNILPPETRRLNLPAQFKVEAQRRQPRQGFKVNRPVDWLQV